MTRTVGNLYQLRTQWETLDPVQAKIILPQNSWMTGMYRGGKRKRRNIKNKELKKGEKSRTINARIMERDREGRS